MSSCGLAGRAPFARKAAAYRGLLGDNNSVTSRISQDIRVQMNITYTLKAAAVAIYVSEWSLVLEPGIGHEKLRKGLDLAPRQI